MAAGDDFMHARWNEARINIKWVIVADAGARSTFCNCKSGGTSLPKEPGSLQFKCVLYAQLHNRHAYDTIVEYGSERTDRYIASLGGAPC